jgi:hypothetical protein
VDRLSLRTFALTLLILTIFALDACLTLLHLQNGGSELNPFMRQIIQSDFQPFVIIKSLGVGFMGCFLAVHQNFKISLYGMYVVTAIYSVLLVYHLAYLYLSSLLTFFQHS